MTATSKAMPPARLTWQLSRPRLERLLVTVRARRLTSVIAEAGFGKSTLLAAWARAMPSAWYTADARDADALELCRGVLGALAIHLEQDGRGPPLPHHRGPDGDTASTAEALAEVIAMRLETHGPAELLLVLDDVHLVPGDSSGARFLEAVIRSVPASTHVVLGSRSDLPFPTERLQGQGQAMVLHAATLAFTPQEVERLVRAALGPPTSPELVRSLHQVTGGWPAAVHLLLEALREVTSGARIDVVAALPTRPGPLLDYLAREVVGWLTPDDRDIVQRLALFDRIPSDLMRVPGIITPRGLVPDLAHRGLLVEVAADGSLSLHSLLRQYVRDQLPLPARTRRAVYRRAAGWLEHQGRHAEALDRLRLAEDPDELRRLVAERGVEILDGGGLRELLDAIEALPDRSRDRGTLLLEGEARMVAGDTQRALRCLETVAGRRQRLPPGLAWRMGQLRYLRGELPEAMAAFERGRTDAGDVRDISLLLAWTATGRWLQGDLTRARADAARALALAESVGADRCLAAAHTVLAMLASVDGDSAAMEDRSAAALGAAERAGDMLQSIRILTNRASHRGDEGRYGEALQDLDRAIERAEISGYAFFHALALSNRGSLLAATGRLEAAATSLEASLVIYRRMGSRSMRYPLLGLADLYRIRGEPTIARAAYREAIEYAEAAADHQALPPLLAGLALVLPDEERDAAQDLARRARDMSQGPGRIGTLLANGWLALAAGSAEAPGFARDAMDEATRRGNPAGQAGALELSAMTTQESRLRLAALREAKSSWARLGDIVSEARVDLAIARLDGRHDSGSALEVQRLAALGVAVAAASAGPGLLRQARRASTGLPAIRTLGGFAAERDGVPVDASAWQSRKARDLVKVLVARRGHRVSRDMLMELLWPEEPPERLHNRLSVALATARGVLGAGPDPSTSAVIRADAEAVWLDREAVAVDVEAFLSAAAKALALAKQHPDATAIASLQAAEAAYGGDFLADDVDAEWAAPLREQARSAYLAVTRILTYRLLDSGDLDAAARYALRILELDPWDEDAHMWLVRTLDAAGRHGEARRQYRSYVARMRELDVEPVTFPSAGPTGTRTGSREVGSTRAFIAR